MGCFQEVVEIWEVYWFGRRLGRGWWEFLFGKVAKGRLKRGFRRPLGWLDAGYGLLNSKYIKQLLLYFLLENRIVHYQPL